MFKYITQLFRKQSIPMVDLSSLNRSIEDLSSRVNRSGIPIVVGKRYILDGGHQRPQWSRYVVRIAYKTTSKEGIVAWRAFGEGEAQGLALWVFEGGIIEGVDGVIIGRLVEMEDSGTNDNI